MIPSIVIPFLLALMYSISRPSSASRTWRDQTVLNAADQSILQITCDVVTTANALLNDTALGPQVLHPKTHPQLLEHSGWARKKNLLKLALSNFERVLLLPGTSNSTIIKPRPRPKRSFLGISTTADDARLDQRIQTLQSSTERAARLTSFLSGKLQKSSELMKNYIRTGEMQKHENARQLIHVQLELTVIWWIRAAEEATQELESLTDSVLRGKLHKSILSELHLGDLIGITRNADSIPVLTFIVSTFRPLKLNCTILVDHNHLCHMPGDDYVSTSKLDFDQPAITHSSSYYSSLSDALTPNAKVDFPKCLTKRVSENFSWNYFCWGSKGRRGQRIEPAIRTLSLHSTEPEQTLLDLEDLQVATSIDSTEADALLDFESSAYLGIDELSSIYSPANSWIDLKTVLLASLVVISVTCNLFALFALYCLREKVKELESKITKTRHGLGFADTEVTTT